MTPKEKARELFGKMYSHFRTRAELDICRQCALIAVDEIINSRKQILVQSIKFYEYWKEVKQEIEKL
jgi:hypothetical protein